jgi:SH3-like domain-containing protein
MFRHPRLMLIAAGCAAALGAMLLIPADERVAVADTTAVADVTSQETIATIDAMLGAVEPQAASQGASLDTGFAAAKPDPNLQTAALTTPETDLEGAPLVDPKLRSDSIGASAVNLRAGPSTATATVAVLQPGQPVQTGETDGGWVEVTLADGTTGWVYSRYLASVAAAAPAPTDEPAAKPDSTTAKATIKGKGNSDLEGRTARIEAAIPARAKPDSGARSVFRTEPGERVRILDVRGDWLHIRTADGSSGWIEAG